VFGLKSVEGKKAREKGFGERTVSNKEKDCKVAPQYLTLK